MKALEIQSLILNNNSANNKTISFECDLANAIFVKSTSPQDGLELLKCLAGVTQPKQGSVLYKQMNIHDFKKSYFKRGRVFIGKDANYCYKKGIFSDNFKVEINHKKTLWQNLKTFAKINNNKDFIYAAVHFFLFHEIINTKVKDLSDCEKELLKISTAMFFENIDFWIIYIDDIKINDPADIRILRHLIQSRTSDCEGLVVYTTNSGNSIEVSNEQTLLI